jgi:DNA-binding CsgD family transcriptional regulator
MDVAETDLRVVVRLLGETAALPGGLMVKKCYLLDGLCDLAGAREWTWALLGPGPHNVPKGFLRRKIGAHFDLPPELPDAASSPHQAPFQPRASSTHAISSVCALDADTESHIVLRRDANDPPYTARESHLACLVLEEIPWLHQRVGPGRAKSPKLSPRQQLTLDLLLLGLGRKEIADQLGISPGTVVGYIGDLYRSFGVNSQAELMRARFQPDQRP